jgi:lysophospholipase L1-like esterase
MWSYLFHNRPIFHVHNLESQPVFRVVLFGDSLINLPCKKYGLREKIQSFFPRLKLELINAGMNGHGISDLLGRVDRDVLAHQPDGVIIFWDSDLCQPDDYLSKSETQDAFSADLRKVIEKIQTVTRNIVIAGPGLFGEGGAMLKSRFNQDNPHTIEKYNHLVEEVAQSKKTTFIDMNKLYSAAVPFFWQLDRYWVTDDGEHPNDYGTMIAAEQFAIAINDWLEETNRR